MTGQDTDVLREALSELIYGDVPSAGQAYTDPATVRAAQNALIAKGFALPRYGADGQYGSETATAIRALQAKMGVPQTGTIDYGVLLMLGVSAPSSSAAATEAARSAAVANARKASAAEQEALREQLGQAKQQLAAAKTPAQVATATQRVDMLQQQVSAAEGGLFGLPWWQVAVGGIGLLAVTIGFASLLGKKARR